MLSNGLQHGTQFRKNHCYQFDTQVCQLKFSVLRTHDATRRLLPLQLAPCLCCPHASSLPSKREAERRRGGGKGEEANTSPHSAQKRGNTHELDYRLMFILGDLWTWCVLSENHRNIVN